MQDITPSNDQQPSINGSVSLAQVFTLKETEGCGSLIVLPITSSQAARRLGHLAVHLASGLGVWGIFSYRWEVLALLPFLRKRSWSYNE